MDFFGPVVDVTSRGWNYVQETQFEEKLDELRSLMEQLKTHRDSVMSRVEAAEDGLLKRTPTVDAWLESVGALEKDVDDVLQEGSKLLKKCCISVWLPWNCWTNQKFGKKMMTKISLVNELRNRGDFQEVAERQSATLVQEMPEDLHTIGLDASLAKALSFVQQNGVGILGLYGLGGVGKTTLLKKINNSFLERSRGFDFVIWAVVSKEVSMERVQKEIGGRLGLAWPDSLDMSSRARDMTNMLRGKTFLLLLDDLWDRLELTAIGIPLPSSENKCKLIFTTRSYDVCGYMEANETIKVECLNEIQAWKLFESKVGVISNDPVFKPLAETVAKECAGLPLALTVTGRTMASKKTVPEWNDAIRILRRHAEKFKGMDKVFSVLKYSYDELADDSTRSCFLFCSIYPEDYNIEIKKLIDQWIGKGYINIDEFDEWNEAVNAGHRIIGDLKAVSLLESSEDYKGDDCVKLHDVIRDMAHWIEKDKILVIPEAGLGEAGKAEKLIKAHSITVTTDAGLRWLGHKPDCPNLTTFFIPDPYKMEWPGLPVDFFLLMPALNFVDIYGILHVPTSICKLVLLEYLSLHFAYLEVGTIIPCEMKNMIRLKHLRLYGQHNCRIPKGLIGHLSNLQSIRLKIEEDLIGHLSCLQSIGLKIEEDGMDGTETHTIQDLGGLNKLICLDITIQTVKDLESILKSQQLMDVTRDLIFGSYGSFGNKDMIKLALSPSYSSSCLSLGCMKSLQFLRIENWFEMDELLLSCSLDDNTRIPLFECLEYLTLFNLPKLVVTWDMRNLQSQRFGKLREIFIYGCHSMVDVTWLHMAPNLQTLKIWSCNGLKEIISDVSGACEEITFSRLRMLHLRDLPNLMQMCVNVLHLPSLEDMRVMACPGVRRLPLKPNNRLISIRGSHKWWNNLKWESESTKFALAQFYIPEN